VTIEGQTGMVFGLDVERDGDAVFFLNSSVSHFIETFRAFDEVLRESCTWTALTNQSERIPL
jgi:hypothetical protein